MYLRRVPFLTSTLARRRLLDDVQQLDVQLRAGRIELTDLGINVSALADLLPNLSFRLARAHVGRLRVEISYSKLLSESLAVFLDDVLIEIAPPLVDSCLPHTSVGAAADEHQVTGARDPDVTNNNKRDGAGGAASGESGTERALPDKTQVGEEGDGLDFLAQWIEQITSKVKVVVNNLTLRVTSANGLEDAGVGAGDRGPKPFLQVRCSSLKWCDETPESSLYMGERPSQPQVGAVGTDRVEEPGKTRGGTALAHKVRYGFRCVSPICTHTNNHDHEDQFEQCHPVRF